MKSQANSASHIPTFMMDAAKVAWVVMIMSIRLTKNISKEEIMTEGLSSIPGIRVPEPEGAFYVFADVTGTGMSDIEFADGALEAGVQLIPASLVTDGDGFVRVSYAADEEAIHEGIRRLRRWL